MDGKTDAAGLAALAICESMLLSFKESELVGAAEVRAILEDAAAAHRNAAALVADGGHHEAAAKVIEHILAGGNSVRPV